MDSSDDEQATDAKLTQENAQMNQGIADLESKLDVMQKSIDAIKAQSSKPEVYNYGEDVDKPKPLTFKDMKPPAEYAGGRTDFLPWHGGFTTYLACRSESLRKLIDFIVSKKEKRIMDLDDFKDRMKEMNDLRGIAEHIEEYQKQLFRHLMDFTKDELKTTIMTGGVDQVFESYRAAVHKGLCITDGKVLQVEARVLHPRPAKDEKDIRNAMQEWRYDRMWLVDAGKKEVNKNLKPHEKTILIALMPDEGANSMKRYLRENIQTPSGSSSGSRRSRSSTRSRSSRRRSSGSSRSSRSSSRSSSSSSSSSSSKGSGSSRVISLPSHVCNVSARYVLLRSVLSCKTLCLQSKVQ